MKVQNRIRLALYYILKQICIAATLDKYKKPIFMYCSNLDWHSLISSIATKISINDSSSDSQTS